MPDRCGPRRRDLRVGRRGRCGDAGGGVLAVPVSSPAWSVARVGELSLEGVVAKCLTSTYIPGRRCTAWVRHKLRRHERLAVTGIRRMREGHVEAIFVARHQHDGSFTGAGAVELGLHRDLVEDLECRLADLPARGAALSRGIRLRCRCVHGLHDGPVRDAILREVVASEIWP